MSQADSNRSRREVLTAAAVSVAAGAASFVPGGKALAGLVQNAAGEGKPLKLLILGGTGFLGPHQVNQAKDAGYELTIANRGKSNPDLFPNVELIEIDREGDLKELEQAVADGKTWDAVIDNSGYIPEHVDATASLLKDAVKTYVFVSTISVYGQIREMNSDESHELDTISDEDAAKVTKISEVGRNPQAYGPLKARCEAAAEKAMPGRVVNIRPGLIAGPGDKTDRYTYWPVRTSMAERCDGKMIVPGTKDAPQPIQIIDVRDLAAFCLTACDGVEGGAYNLVAKPEPITNTVEAIRKSEDKSAEPVMVDGAFLTEQECAWWAELPAMVPEEGDYAGMTSVSNEKALAAGLKTRPNAETAVATLQWWKGEEQRPLRGGLSEEKEAKVLQAWADREQQG